MPSSIDSLLPLSSSSSFSLPTLLKTSAIFLSASASGALLSISFFGVPRLLEAPTPLMLQLWERTLLAGKARMPPLGGSAALLYFYLAYRLASSTTAATAATAAATARAYALAGGLCVGIVPYTYAVMMPTNKRLLAKLDESRRAAALGFEAAGLDDLGAKQLVDRWGMLNLGRGVMLGSAALIALAVSL